MMRGRWRKAAVLALTAGIVSAQAPGGSGLLIAGEIVEDDESAPVAEEAAVAEDVFGEVPLIEEASEAEGADAEGEEEAEGQSETEQVFASGTCGDNAEWKLSEDGRLTVLGIGDMRDYTSEDPAPWMEYAARIAEVAVEAGITSVGDYAFSDLSGAERIELPVTVSWIGKGAFRGCESLGSVSAKEGNGAFTVLDGVLYSSDLSQLIVYPEGLKDSSFEVPATVRTIREYAFYGQDYLEELKLASSDVMIGDNAFAQCTALSSITM